MYLLFVLLLVATAYSATYLPTSYVSPKSYQSKDSEVVMYRASFCPLSNVNGKLAVLKVTLQDQPWGPIHGVYVKIEVYNSTLNGAQLLCTNVQGSEITQFCSFTYFANMGSLYIRAESGPTGNIQYTIHLNFDVAFEQLAEPLPFVPSRQISQKRLADGPVYELKQIAKLDTSASVPNAPPPQGLVTYSFDFCPSDPNYNITVVVISTDLSSAFETYLCASSPCSAPQAIIRNTCNCPITVLTLQGAGKSFPNLFVTIRGRGENPGTSSFLLSVTLDQASTQ
jgi:hypothetical protein